MKSIFKFLGIGFGILFSIILLFGLFVYINSSSRMNQTFKLVDHGLILPSNTNDLKEGKRLFISRGCVDCHGENLSGATFIDDPAIGKYTGKNLTSGKGGFSKDRDFTSFSNAVRHGVGEDGKPLLFMPSSDFHGMTDVELGTIFQYVRSVPPVDKPYEPQQVGPLARVLFVLGKMPLLVTAEKIDHEIQSEKQQTVEVSVAYGKYLAAGCTGCHGEKLTGGPIAGAPPEWPEAQNITKVGIEKYSEAQFLNAIRTGKRPDGSVMKPPMPWQNMAHMTDTELKSIRLYLLTL